MTAGALEGEVSRWEGGGLGDVGWGMWTGIGGCGLGSWVGVSGAVVHVADGGGAGGARGRAMATHLGRAGVRSVAGSEVKLGAGSDELGKAGAR